MDRSTLFSYLKEANILNSPLLMKTFQKVDRRDFVLPEYKRHSYEDHPLPIGFGQSISQPSTVAFMLELVNPKKGEVILDVGTGSGWTTAMLSEAVGKTGRVYTTEIIPELYEYAKNNIKKYAIKNVTMRQSSGRLGLPEFSPFHKILVSAEAEDLPATLVDQLTTGGRLVIPIAGSIISLEKISDTHLETRSFPGFAFVPLQ